MKFSELPIGTRFKSQDHMYLKLAVGMAREIEHPIAIVFHEDTPVEPIVEANKQTGSEESPS
jgi:hypothetical protein